MFRPSSIEHTHYPSDSGGTNSKRAFLMFDDYRIPGTRYHIMRKTAGLPVWDKGAIFFPYKKGGGAHRTKMVAWERSGRNVSK